MTQLLDQAIVEAIEQAKQEQRQAEEDWQASIAQAKQKAISEFQLPFDAETIALLPPCTYKCDAQDPQKILVKALFTYQGVNFRVWGRSDCAIKHWKVAAAIETEDEDCPERFIAAEDLHFYPDPRYYHYLSPEQLRVKLLVFMAKAVAEAQKERDAMQLPAPAPEPRIAVKLSSEERLEMAAKIYTAMIAGGYKRESWNEMAVEAIEAVEAFVAEFNDWQQ